MQRKQDQLIHQVNELGKKLQNDQENQQKQLQVVTNTVQSNVESNTRLHKQLLTLISTVSQQQMSKGSNTFTKEHLNDDTPDTLLVVGEGSTTLQEKGPTIVRKGRQLRKQDKNVVEHRNYIDNDNNGEAESTEEPGWIVASRRKEKKQPPGQRSSAEPVDDSHKAPKILRRSPASLVRRRIPKAEAVTISEPKEGVTYADIMKQVMGNVNLADIEVEVGGVRRTKSGGILFQVEGKEKADRLSSHLQIVVGEMAKKTNKKHGNIGS